MKYMGIIVALFAVSLTACKDENITNKYYTGEEPTSERSEVSAEAEEAAAVKTFVIAESIQLPAFTNKVILTNDESDFECAFSYERSSTPRVLERDYPIEIAREHYSVYDFSELRIDLHVSFNDNELGVKDLSCQTKNVDDFETKDVVEYFKSKVSEASFSNFEKKYTY